MHDEGKIVRDVFQIKGDVPHPDGSGLRGATSGVDLTASAEGYPLVYDRIMQRLLTIDVYKIDGQPMWLHLYCPRCENAIKITEETKEIHYEPQRAPKELLEFFSLEYLCQQLYPGKRPQVAMLGGTLSVSPFRCIHPADGAVCGWHASIERNIARAIT